MEKSENIYCGSGTERVFDDKGFVKENKFEFTIKNERVS